jgi:hypothetical protein
MGPSTIDVTYNGHSYCWHSDRFYLDEPDIVMSQPQSQTATSDDTTSNSSLRPYFNRRALVSSLIVSNRLEAVIIQTFSLRLSQLTLEFPSLFDVNCCSSSSSSSSQNMNHLVSPPPPFPVLVLHGDDTVPTPEEQDKGDIDAKKRRYRCYGGKSKHLHHSDDEGGGDLSDEGEGDDEGDGQDITCAAKHYRKDEVYNFNDNNNNNNNNNNSYTLSFMCYHMCSLFIFQSPHLKNYNRRWFFQRAQWFSEYSRRYIDSYNINIF